MSTLQEHSQLQIEWQLKVKEWNKWRWFKRFYGLCRRNSITWCVPLRNQMMLPLCQVMNCRVVFLFMSKGWRVKRIIAMNKPSKYQMHAEVGEGVHHEGVVETGKAEILWNVTTSQTWTL
jgi:hypothetical protein